jgi:flagellar basal-body rod protein FlgC
LSGIFSTLKVTASALTAQRLRMDIIANNIANAETTHSSTGKAYQREQVVFTTEQPRSLSTSANDAGAGLRVQSILTDPTPGRQVYDPTHPDADADGFVTYPNVNVATEMTDMLSATRSYEANVTVFNAIKSMFIKALEIGRS